MKTLIRLEPQPVIRGSFVQDGDKWHYCELADIDRLVSKESPKWKTIINPFGATGELRELPNGWFWISPQNLVAPVS